MVRISISAEAFEVLASTIPFGSIGCEPKLNAKGERLIWIEQVWADKLRALRGPGESYSDVILRLVAVEARVGRGDHFMSSVRTWGRGTGHERALPC
jgi:hypothetical protein